MTTSEKSPKMSASERARATDEHVKPLLEKELGDMRAKTERLRQERLAGPTSEKQLSKPKSGA